MANGVTLREEVSQLQQSELDALRLAYERMMGFSAADNRGWLYWAGYHGFPNWYCWHHGRVSRGLPQPVNLFLPWHRAYLLYFENVAKYQSPTVAIPWWDWSSDQSRLTGVPAAFTAPTVNDQPNPLFQGPVPAIQDMPARVTRRFPGLPSRLPTEADVEAILQLSSFTDFTTQIEDLHDGLHGWMGGRDPSDPALGGDLGTVLTAAYDPLFWSHHCMIDRLWYLWQLRHGVNNIPSEYLDWPLRPFDLTVADVLNINRLGYEYAVAAVTVPV